MSRNLLESYQGAAQGLMRIVIGFLFMTHGGQKLFGWFGAEAPREFFSRYGIAGTLEFFGGSLVMLGIFTGPVAFVLAGEMAVAYFWRHVPRGFWPWGNGGELAALYSFVFLFFATAGGGSFRLDAFLEKQNRA